jgi:hypothetical protein
MMSAKLMSSGARQKAAMAGDEIAAAQLEKRAGNLCVARERSDGDLS